jgi:hypothetical protein
MVVLEAEPSSCKAGLRDVVPGSALEKGFRCLFWDRGCHETRIPGTHSASVALYPGCTEGDPTKMRIK